MLPVSLLRNVSQLHAVFSFFHENAQGIKIIGKRHISLNKIKEPLDENQISAFWWRRKTLTTECAVSPWPNAHVAVLTLVDVGLQCFAQWCLSPVQCTHVKDTVLKEPLHKENSQLTEAACCLIGREPLWLNSTFHKAVEHGVPSTKQSPRKPTFSDCECTAVTHIGADSGVTDGKGSLGI